MHIINRRILRGVAAGLLLALPLVLIAHEYDPENAEEINEVCAGCHDEYGQGGKQGKYPRIAGLPQGYLKRQLLLFQDRERPNMPMVEHVEKRELPLSDIEDISIWLSRIQLKTKLPPVDETAPGFDAYARLQEAKKLMQVPRSEGDTKHGEKLYHRECRSCHGAKGMGNARKEVPMLAGQYTQYLWRQVKRFLKGERIHDPDEPDDELLKDFTHDELRDIFAWLSVQDD